MKIFKALFIASTIQVVAAAAYAESTPHAAVDTVNTTAPTAVSTATADMAVGEVRKIDMAAQKITLKHGEIKNLDMPGMTMVFQIKNPALLANFKAGDKVRFAAEKSGGAIVVTEIQAAP
jgi:Cu(I)/Ag(I) efflux system periplasmic protein CusF